MWNTDPLYVECVGSVPLTFSYLMKVWVEPVDTLLQGFETHKSGTTSTNTSATSTPTGLVGTPSVHKHKKRESEVRVRNEGEIAHELVSLTGQFK